MVLSKEGKEAMCVASKLKVKASESEGLVRALRRQAGSPFEGRSFQGSREESRVALVRDFVA